MKSKNIMTANHMRTGIEPTLEMLCILNTCQTLDNVQHNCDVGFVLLC